MTTQVYATEVKMQDTTTAISRHEPCVGSDMVADVEKTDIVSFSRAKRGYAAAKRAFDICVSVAMLIVLLPVFVFIAIAVKIDSKGSVFFSHNRIGQNGKIIRVYKFRSMVSNSADMFARFTPAQKAEFEQNFKLEHDPRVTRAGRFLRKTSLDELPQLINILKGDISFVGPRPVVEYEIYKYGDKAEKLVSVKPGLTGLWQINGRSCITYADRVDMDMFYIDNCSFPLDVKIFFLTIFAVLRRKGAI
jgi:lipopolysaccharide/colanic/teichoic acid biosynthesis glycosyltransferase